MKKRVFIYLIGFAALIAISYCVNNFTKSILDKISYYGSIITIYSLVINFIELFYSSSIQEKINETIQRNLRELSLQNNSKIDRYFRDLIDNLYKKDWKFARINLRMIMDLLPNHDCFDKIQEIIKEEIIKENDILKPLNFYDSFFETLDGELSKIMNSPKEIKQKEIEDLKIKLPGYIYLINRICKTLVDYIAKDKL